MKTVIIISLIVAVLTLVYKLKEANKNTLSLKLKVNDNLRRLDEKIKE